MLSIKLLKKMKSEILKILKQYPTLNSFGFGLYNEGRGLSVNERMSELKKLQDQLLDNVEQIQDVVSWLEDIDKIVSFNKRHSSYGLKHIVEKYAHRYVANGSFIVGSVLSGFKVQIATPNAYFNISEKSLKLKTGGRPYSS